MDADAFPEVPEDLLIELERLYPEKPIMPGQTIDELMHYGGQRALIKWLREVYTAQKAEDDPAEEGDQDQSE